MHKSPNRSRVRSDQEGEENELCSVPGLRVLLASTDNNNNNNNNNREEFRLNQIYTVGRLLKVLKHITAHAICWTGHLSPLITADFEGVLQVPQRAIGNKCCFLVPPCFSRLLVSINNMNSILIFL